MNFEFFITRRTAFSNNLTFSRTIIRIAIAAIAFGFAVMIVSTAIITGFKNQITDKVFGFWGHIHITAPTNINTFDAIPIAPKPAFFANLKSIQKVNFMSEQTFLGFSTDRKVEKSTYGGVRHTQIFATIPGIIKTKETIEGILLKGVGKDFDWKLFNHYIIAGRAFQVQDTAASREVVVSQQTADRLKINIGDKFTVFFVRNKEQLKRRFEITGIYKTGLEEFDRKFALIDIRQVQQLLGWQPDQVAGVEVFLDDLRDLEPLADHIYSNELSNELYATTIREKFSNLFDWLQLQDLNNEVILTLMLVVAIINMVTALLILILEKTNMIGILKALGSTDWSIRKIFLYYAAYIISVGLFWGNTVGILLCRLQSYFKIIKLSEENYYLPYAPIELNWWAVLALNIGALFITLLVLIIPSYLVTHITPVRAIRFK